RIPRLVDPAVGGDVPRRLTLGAGAGVHRLLVLLVVTLAPAGRQFLTALVEQPGGVLDEVDALAVADPVGGAVEMAVDEVRLSNLAQWRGVEQAHRLRSTQAPGIDLLLSRHRPEPPSVATPC